MDFHFAVVAKGPLGDCTIQEGKISIPVEGRTAETFIGFSFKDVAEAQVRADEAAESGFDASRREAEAAWEYALSGVEANFTDETEEKRFYSALYHSLVKPVDCGTGFRDYSTLWDVYKTQLPLVLSTQPQVARRMMEDMMSVAERYGYFPIAWMMTDEAERDFGQAVALAVYTLSDAFFRGVLDKRDYPRLKRIFASEIGSANTCGKSPTYVLDLAGACRAAAFVADECGDAAFADEMKQKSRMWKDVFDPATGLLVENAKYYEGNFRNYSFRPLPDMDERVRLAGGEEKFCSLLDDFFRIGYESDAQETREPRIGYFEGLNNESDMESPYAYYWCGRYDRAAEVIDAVRRYRFGDGAGGCPGNNDSGGTSSWYVWSCLGLYPLTGTPDCLIASPSVTSAEVRMSKGVLKIAVERESDKSIYPVQWEWNGRRLDRPVVKVRELENGGELKIRLANRPDVATGADSDGRPALVVRIDDNHSPDEWRKVCAIFERHGFRCSLAVNVAQLDEGQGRTLRELAARGHEVLDHTPNHSLYSVSYPDDAAFGCARKLPFAHDADERSRTVFFDPVVETAHVRNRTMRAKVTDGRLVVVNGEIGKPMYSFVKFASRDGVFGLTGADFVLRDFWRRKPKPPLDTGECDALVLAEEAIQPCEGLLRELAAVSREGFMRFGLPPPKVWIRPGGWYPGYSQEAIERIYGREFGYIGADSRIGSCKPGESRWSMDYTAMRFFDQDADITPEELVESIGKRLADSKDYILLTHMWHKNLPGGMTEWFKKTERFAQLLSERKVRVATLGRLIEERFDSKIRVGTYNIRNERCDKATPNAWDSRKDDLVALVDKIGFDVFGIQEAYPEQVAYLDGRLLQYGVTGEFRNEDRKSGEASAVFYRNDRFEKKDGGTFWLSETPDVPGSKSWGAAYTRICTWALLKDRFTGQTFCFANAHTDNKSALAREKGALLIVERIRKAAPSGTPIVFVGDHNCRETDAAAEAVSKFLKNAFYVSETPPSGPWRTYNGWKWMDTEHTIAEALALPCAVRNARARTVGADKAQNGGFEWKDFGSRIDYIYVSEGIRVLNHETHGDARPNSQLYPSDHFPVSADIVLGSSGTGAVFGEAKQVYGVGKDAMALCLNGNLLYVGDGPMLRIYDVSRPMAPKKLGEVGGFNSIRQIAEQDGMLYVATREYGLWIVDATDPGNPRIRSRFDCCELATGVDVAGDVCFLAQRQYGVEFIDVSDPDRPRHIAMRKTDESQSVKYRDGYLYSGEWGAGMVTVFDVHDMANVREVACEELHGYGDGVWLQGDFLYCATGHHSRHRGDKDGFGKGHGLDIFDVSDPVHPRHVSRLDYPPFFSRGLDMWTVRTSGNVLFAAQTHNGLFAVDISDKTNPKTLDRWTKPDPAKPEWPSLCVGSLAVGDGVIYAAVKGAGVYAVPAVGAKAEKFDRGLLPKNASFREEYPTDESEWYVWRPKEQGQARAVAVKGDIVYAACGEAGLWALEILPGGGFHELARLAGRRSVMDVSVQGERLFTAEGLDGFAVYELESPARIREIARLDRIGGRNNLALCVTAIDSNWAFLSDRHGVDLYDIGNLPKFRHVLHVKGSPGWDKYLSDAAVGDGRLVAFSAANSSLKWIDIAAKPEPNVVVETKKNFISLFNGVCTFRDGLSLVSGENRYGLLAPGEGDPPDGGKWRYLPLAPAFSGDKDTAVSGIPRSDGRRVVFTNRFNRRAALYDFEDAQNPRLLKAWKLSGNPDIAQFHGGRVVIPCGYQGVLLQKSNAEPQLLSSASTNVVEKLPAAKWDFESSDGLAMKECAILAEPGRGKCLKLVLPSSRATVETTAALPDVASPKAPYTLTIWLKPDKSVISDADVEMAKLGGRRMTKFASAMHDGKWHHLAVTYDPARTNAEYAAYLDWPDEKSPWRFMSFYEKDTGMSKCILPFSFGDGKAVFGGKVGMSLFSVGYSGMIDDVVVYNRALTDDEVRDMAVVVGGVGESGM